MAVIKCKMCGGDLNIAEGAVIAECEYCGSRQTIPNQDSEKKLTLFARAERLRRGCEFDKAAGVYESIVAEFPEEAEAYWGLVLCRYGIEYVDDPATGKKIPTCHRSSFESILEDEDFAQACENADAIARRLYREEAKAIEEIRRGILEVSGKEEPYDIFICYKETDEYGGRTIDSVMAQDVYDALTEKGYRVFFSRISLEDKLGSEYEPYIFAALNSAGVMLVFGTDYEYFNAVWVKNEWSRFLALIAAGQKKTLIPCYKNVDAYDMPKEFQRLQAQDMGKVGAVQDLLRGIGKILPRQKAESIPVSTGGPGADALTRRGFTFLEDGEWEKAEEYYDKALDLEPETAEAYFGKALAAQRLHSDEELKQWRLSPERLPQERAEACREDEERIQAAVEKYYRKFYLDDSEIRREMQAFDRNYVSPELSWQRALEEEEAYWTQDKLMGRAMRYAGGEFRVRINKLRREIGAKMKEGMEEAKRREKSVIRQQEEAYRAFLEEAEQKIAGLFEAAEQKMEEDYRDACAGLDSAVEPKDFSEAGMAFLRLRDYKDSVVRKKECWRRRAELYKKERERIAPASNLLAANDFNAAAICPDGSVIMSLDSEDGYAFKKWTMIRESIRKWTDIKAIGMGYTFAIGLREDGTVAAEGDDSDGSAKGARDAGRWTGIREIAFGQWHAVGLREDGTVLAAGFDGDNQCEVGDWKDIVAVSAGLDNTVGLRSDGTVVVSGDNSEGQCNVEEWSGIVAVCAGADYTLGLTENGNVLAVGLNDNGQCDVRGWSHIVAISCYCKDYTTSSFPSVTFGLKWDGTVMRTGSEDSEKRHLVFRSPVVALCGSLGLCEDGRVVNLGDYSYKEVERWKLFSQLKNLEQERREARSRREAEAEAVRRKKAAEEAALRQRQAQEEAERRRREEERCRLEAERESLGRELSNLKGVFSGKRRREIETRLKEIEALLKGYLK